MRSVYRWPFIVRCWQDLQGKVQEVEDQVADDIIFVFVVRVELFFHPVKNLTYSICLLIG